MTKPELCKKCPTQVVEGVGLGCFDTLTGTESVERYYDRKAEVNFANARKMLLDVL